MTIERRDLILEEKTKTPINRDKLAKDLDEGMALASMLDSRGWKLVYDGFIKLQLDEARFLEAAKEELSDVRAEMRILRQFLKFIETRIDNADSAAKKIKS